MSSIYTGKDAKYWWGLEPSFGNGDNTSHTHQPPNPMERYFVPRPRYENTKLRTASSLKENVVFTSLLNAGEASLDEIFVDPFMGLAFFTHKALTGDWTTGEAYSKIEADFSALDDVDSLWIYSSVLNESGSNPIDKLTTGIKITKRALIAEVGKLIRENLDLVAADIAEVAADTFDSVEDFDDGEVADWDTWRHSSDVVLTWGASELDAANYGFEWTKIEFGVEVPQNMLHKGSSLKVEHQHIQELRPYARVTGWLDTDGNTLVDEIESEVSDKTKATLKFQFDSTASEEKFDQFTSAYLDDIEGLDELPRTDEPLEVTLVFYSDDGAYSLEYNYLNDNYADPSGRITTSA
jgi:hypothetical protein